MTVSTESTLTSYSGDGSTTDFATGFPFFDEGDLVVVVETTATNERSVQALGSDYSVTGGQVGIGSPGTGTVTMNVAPESGETLHIYRASGYTQDTNLVDNTAQRASVTESAFDRLATYVQEMDHRLDRAVRLPEIGDAVDALKGAYGRRDTVVGFDDSGELVLVAQSALGGDGSGGDGVWGSISGTLSDQIDLQAALNAKAGVTSLNSHVDNTSNPHDLSWGQVQGTLSNQTDLQTALDAKLEDVSPGDIDATNAPADNQVPTYDSSTGKWTWETAELGGGSGVTTFIGLSDSPGSFTGEAGKFARVNPAEDALVFGLPDWGQLQGTLSDQSDLQTALDAKLEGVAWGDVTGTLSNQTDLQTALDAKLEGVAWGDVTGTLSNQTDLQNALDAKLEGVAWGDITGTLSSQTDLQTALDAKLEDVALNDLSTSNSPVDGDILTASGGGLFWASEVAGSIYSTTQAGVESLNGTVRDATFSADDSLLLCANTAIDSVRGLVVYDTSTWAIDTGAPTFSSGLAGVDISPNGNMVAVSSGTALVYDPSTWTETASLSAHSGGGRCKFSTDNAHLAIASSASPYIFIYQTSDWTLVSGLPTLAGAANGLHFSPDGAYLAIAHDGAPYLTVLDTTDWSVVSGAPTLAGEGNDCAFTAGSDKLAVVHRGSPYLTVLDTSDWSTVGGTPTLDARGNYCAFSSGDDYLAVAVFGGPNLAVIQTATWSVLGGTYEPASYGQACAFNSTDSYLAVGYSASSNGLAIVQENPEAAVTSVNGQTGDVTLTSDNISEGSTNQYHTDTRAVDAIKADAAWNATDWDTAFGWGDHAAENYLKSVDATDLNSTNSPSDGQVPTYDQTSGGFTWSTAGSGSGAEAFTDLTDTPGSYTGADGQVPVVDGTSLVFTEDLSALSARIDASGAPVTRTLEDRFTDTVHVKDFGAVGDGVTDDAPAIQSAINSGARRIILDEVHRIESTLEITDVTGPVEFVGHGTKDMTTGEADPGTDLRWHGTAGGRMFFVGPDTSQATAKRVTGVRLFGVHLSGRGVAAEGLVIESCRNSAFEVSADGCTDFQIATGRVPYSASIDGPNTACQFCHFWFYASTRNDLPGGNTAKGVILGAREHASPDRPIGQSSPGNTSFCYFHDLDVRTDSGVGVVMGDTDNNTFQHIRVFASGSPTEDVVLKAAIEYAGSVYENHTRHVTILRLTTTNQCTVQGTDVTSSLEASTDNVFFIGGNSTAPPVLGTDATAFTFDSGGYQIGWATIGGAFGDTQFHADAARDRIGSAATQIQAGASVWTRFSDSGSNDIVELRTDGANRARFNFPTTDGTERFRFNAPVHVVSLTETSDIALKQNVEDLDPKSCLAAIRDLQPRTYQWKANGRDDIGLVAQEVAKILPDLVDGGDSEDDEAPKGVRYTKLVTYLIGAVQELADALANRHGRL